MVAVDRQQYDVVVVGCGIAGLSAAVSALEQGMPPAAGMALGVDRLAMVILDEAEIRRVLPFAWDEL